MDASVYLDHNATTPVRDEAMRAVAEALRAGGNASSVHGSGRAARARMENAREAVAALAGALPGNVVFTSGGSEANNMALKGAGRGRVLASAVEHPSVLRSGLQIETVAVDGRGVIDLAALDAQLAASSEPALVSLMLANNETGVIEPVAEAAAIAHAHGALIHCDAVQAAGKMVLEMDVLGVDMMSLSAHKLGGPQGVGALLLAAGVDVAPLVEGGGQERGIRQGTENGPGIAGFGAAARAAAAGIEGFGRLAALRDGLERALVRAFADVVVLGAGAGRLVNTSAIARPGVLSDTVVMALDMEGVEVSAGSACSSGKVTASHVLAAMEAGDSVARSAIRVSLGRDSGQADVDRFLDAYIRVQGRARQRKPAA